MPNPSCIPLGVVFLTLVPVGAGLSGHREGPLLPLPHRRAGAQPGGHREVLAPSDPWTPPMGSVEPERELKPAPRL